MVEPVLTLLVASALPWTAEMPRRPTLETTIVHAVRVIRASGFRAEGTGKAEPTVCDVPYYYNDFTPVNPPACPPQITYDWRSPVILDVP